jgi:hypothetical protein
MDNSRLGAASQPAASIQPGNNNLSHFRFVISEIIN